MVLSLRTGRKVEKIVCVLIISVVTMIGRGLKRVCDIKTLMVFNCMFLSLNMYVVVMQLNNGIWPIETYYPTAFSRADKQLMLDTMRVFVNALDRANITYFMYSGTLIGSYRHHGFIPWDDDIDLVVNASSKEDLVKITEPLKPDYQLWVCHNDVNCRNQWKFYPSNGKGYIHQPFKFPYIDIFFFRENNSHIWDESPRYISSYVFQKSTVFPLVQRPFAGYMLPSPCNAKAVLKQSQYNIDVCRSSQFSHSLELPMFSFTTLDVSCDRLGHIHPFVHRGKVGGGKTMEKLIIGDYVLGNITVQDSCS